MQGGTSGLLVDVTGPPAQPQRRRSRLDGSASFPSTPPSSFRKGPAALRRQMPEILENADDQLSTRIRGLLAMLWEEWKELERQIQSLNSEIEGICAGDAACQ
jgi:transposase